MDVVRMVRRRLAPLLVLTGLSCPALAGAESLPALPDAGRPVIGRPDGTGPATVHALARDGNTVFLGGEFSYIGPRADGPLVRLDASGRPDPAFPRVASGSWWAASVDAVEPDGAGGVFIGGRFATVGGVARRNLAHILADGTVDPGWDPAPDGRVTALLRDGATLYVAGSFWDIGGAARHRLAALGAGGAATGWDPAPDGRVRALAAAGGTLHVGGDFAGIAGQARAGLASFSQADGTLSGFAPALDGDVTALAADATRLYAAGDFATVTGEPRGHLAAFTTADGALDTGWAPVADSAARRLVDGDDRIYVLSRDWQTIAGHAGYGVALTPDTGAYVADSPTGDEAGVATLDGTRLLASGRAADGGGSSEGILSLSAPSAPAFLGRGLGLDGVKALARFGDGVLVAGDVRSLGGVRRDDLAAIDLATDLPTAWTPPAGGAVYALAVADGTVFAGGSHLVALDEATGAARPWDLDTDGDVRALAAGGGSVYAGGAFTSLAGAARAHLAAIDASDGTLAGWDPGADGTVRALALDGGDILAGGDFTTLAGASRAHLGAVTATGAPAGWQADADGPVDALAVDGGVAYAGGAFTSIGGRPRTGAAALGTADGAVTSWDPQLWTGETVDAIAAWRGHVWLGGEAWGYGLLEAHDTVTGAWSGSAWMPGPVHSLLAAGDSTLLSGGDDEGPASLSFSPRYDASPEISGTPAEGETLTCRPGSWHDDTLAQTWSWWRNDVPIDGATADTYVFTAADAGQAVTCRETRTNLAGSVTAESPPAGVALPVATVAPAILPAPVAGTTVRCDPGSWSGAPDSYDYEWLRNGEPFRWTASYAVRASDAGAQLSCRVWAHKGGARVLATGAAATVPTPPAKVSGPTVSGSSAGAGYARVDDTLTCAPGTWTGAGIAYSFRYLRDSTAVSATAAYTVTAADLGHRLACEVTASNAGGSRRATVTVSVLAGRPVNSAAPTVAGIVAAGATVTCRPGAWSNAPIGWSMRWFIDGAQVATGPTLVLADAHQGHGISCDVAATWNGGTTAPVASAPVTVPLHPPVSQTAPVLFGDTIVGGSLTCVPGDWRYASTFAYTWLRDGVAIGDGTDHAVVPMDAGHRLSCRVTATGPGGRVLADSAESFVPGETAHAIAGGTGADRLVGGAHADVIRGGAGNDRLDGGAGADVLLGGAGADRLVGGPGRDRLLGGSGNDLLDARDHRGGDVVRCGPGRDRALVDRGDRVSRDCESVRRSR